MKLKIFVILVTLFIFPMIVVCFADILSTQNYTIEKSVISQGAINGETENYNIQSTISQESPVSVLSSNSYHLRSGFVLSTDDSWQVTLYAIGEDLGASNYYEAYFGVSTSPILIEAPPMPPPDCTVIMDFYRNEQKYTKVILAEGEESYSWVVAFDPHGTLMPPNARTAVMRWDPSQFHPDAETWYYRLKEGFTGNGKTVVSDMRKVTEYTITGDSVQYFTIECTQDKCIDVEITLKAGWNLISIPVTPCDSSKLNDLFPDASVAYGFEGKYIYAEELEPTKGYWIKVPENKTYVIRGQELTGYSVALSKGWYLMGTPNCQISKPVPEPPEALGPVYIFESSYSQPEDDLLSPGQGFWVKIEQDSIFSMVCQ